MKSTHILKNQILQPLKVVILALLLAVGISYIDAAWSGPTQAPPGGNTNAPINTGTTDQVKNAGLSVNTLSVFGNGLFTGGIGIGTTSTSISTTLDVDGEIKVGNSGLGCTASTNGAIRYNSTSQIIEYCNGTDWLTCCSPPVIVYSADLTVPGGNVSASSYWTISGPYPPSNAIDNNLSAASYWALGAGGNPWIEYNFGAGNEKEIRRFKLTFNDISKSFIGKVQYYNGSTFVDVPGSDFNYLPTNVGESKTFDVASVGGTKQRWRIYFTSPNTSGSNMFSEMEMMEVVGS